MTGKTFYIETFGCQMNAHDSEKVVGTLVHSGYTQVPDAESAEMFAETISLGDPTYAGALAGVSLGLPVYHVTEPEVRAVIEPGVYAAQIEMMEMVLDIDAIHQAVRSVRARAAS